MVCHNSVDALLSRHRKRGRTKTIKTEANVKITYYSYSIILQNEDIFVLSLPNVELAALSSTK